MAKLIVFSGLMGAGKSTAARELLKQQPSYRLFAADDVRAACPSFSAADITHRLVQLAAWWLRLGATVVIDACNLHPHDRIRWETLAIAMDAELDWRKLSTPVERCIRQDAGRPQPVGDQAIIKQAAEYGLLNAGQITGWRSLWRRFILLF